MSIYAQDYGATLERAGFGDVSAIDHTDYFMEILRDELSRYEPMKEEVLRRFTIEDYDAICGGWKEKMVRCRRGEQVWGYFTARKLYSK